MTGNELSNNVNIAGQYAREKTRGENYRKEEGKKS